MSETWVKHELNMESWKMLKDVERCPKIWKPKWVPCEFHVSSLSFRIASYKRPQPGAAGCRVLPGMWCQLHRCWVGAGSLRGRAAPGRQTGKSHGPKPWGGADPTIRMTNPRDESKILIRRINSIYSILQLSTATSYQDRDLNSSRIRSDLRSVAMERHMTMNG